MGRLNRFVRQPREYTKSESLFVSSEWTFLFLCVFEFCYARFEITNTAQEENCAKYNYDGSGEDESQIQDDNKKLAKTDIHDLFILLGRSWTPRQNGTLPT